MQTIFNRVNCESSRKNTGFGDCVLDVKQIKGGFKVPKDFKLSVTDLASVSATIAALEAAVKADNPSQRIYPIHNLVNPADKSDDKTVETFSDGSEQVVREGLTKWAWQLLRGKLSLHIALRTHNENGGYFIFYDADFRIYGYGKNREIYGLPLNWIWADPFKQNDGSKATAYMFGVAFDPTYLNDNLGHAKLNAGVQDIKGLRDIDIVVNSFDSDTGLANISLLSADSMYNLYDLYSTNFSGSGKALWTAENGEDGGGITITTVAAVVGSKSFNVQFNIGDADYPTDGTILLSLVEVSDLEAKGVAGFEGGEATLEVSGS